MIHVRDESTDAVTVPAEHFDRAYAVYRFGATLLRLIPRPVARTVMSVFGWLASYLVHDTRSTVENNFRRVLGPQTDKRTLQLMVRNAFMSYGRYWSDVAHLPSLVGKSPASLLGQQEIALFEQRLPPGAVILALPHLGAWEIGGLWAIERGIRMHSVAEPASSARLTEWFTRQRERLGLEVLPLGNKTVGELLRALRRDELVALLADRDIVGDGVEVTFFGDRTKMPGGPAMLAIRSGAPLYPCAVYHDRRDCHRPVLLDPVPTDRRGTLREDIVRITQDLAHAFEQLIVQAPEQWHVFQPQWALSNNDGH